MEMVATTINLLNGHDPQAENATVGNIEAHVLSGLNPMLTNASGQLWTAAYVNVTGDLPADILSNIAAEQRAKAVYEYLHRQIQDKKVRETIDFLLNREEAHNTMSTPGNFVGQQLHNPNPPMFTEPQNPPQH